MPNLTVTLTTAQITRIRAAFGPGTAQADVEQAIKDFLKNKVRDYEAGVDANAKYDSVTSEVW